MGGEVKEAGASREGVAGVFSSVPCVFFLFFLYYTPVFMRPGEAIEDGGRLGGGKGVWLKGWTMACDAVCGQN